MTRLSCLSISGYDVPLEVLERLAYSREELAKRLTALSTNSHAHAVTVLSTCQRTEVYATWTGEPDDAALLAALASDRGVPGGSLNRVARTYRDDAAARHLLRVASGLESFVLGETEIAGQVRAAAEISRTAGGGDVVLDRLMDAAISASRKRHRLTSIAATSRSVASVAVDAVVRSSRDTITGQRLLVVGAGSVAAVAVARAVELGAIVTVCNRTRRNADRFVAAGARVVDLADLADCLATNDIVILATAAPRPLVDVRTLQSARPAGAGSLTLVDLSLPRNVDPSVRALASVRLIDLADLRAGGASDAGDLADEVAATEEIIEAELGRYLRWLESRSAAAALGRMRRDADDIAREELARIADRMPAEIRLLVEQTLLRTVHRLVHGPTRELLAAATAGDTRLVNILAGLYNSTSSTSRRAIDDAVSTASDPGATTTRLYRPAFDVQRSQTRAPEQAAEERGVHPAHQFAM
ncbi:glutamyl-tRNA reductase [Micromonospora sp. NPDC005806]|uniref:glutamyl-tRNA reductase n=1 Tax=Micromonospora sp. NPDC005806 TaxID=3364234 RepID=UPI0036C6EAD9